MSATAPFESAASTDRKRSISWPTWRQVWFQLHWLVGITAGTVLVVIGLSGATLAFKDEILDAINPGVRHVAPRAEPALSPADLVQALRASHPHERVAQITLAAEPGSAARVLLAPPPGVRRGESLYLDPYTAAIQPPMKGAAFFEWVENLHRWLLMPRDDGRIVAGILSICLLGMALSGLYLRWPKQVLDLRAWLGFDFRLKGRSFLWGLHSVLGTWALALYLVSTSTGIYWSFDVVRSTVDGWLQVDRQGRSTAGAKAAKPAEEKRGGKPKGAEDKEAAPLDLAPAWATFTQRASGWTLVNMRLPQRGAQAIDFNWLGPDAPHERARHRMQLQATGELKYDERYEAGTLGSRFQSTIYPLHMGTYFGLPGRLAMTFGALMLPVFAVTGWLLYLKRRGTAREALAARTALAGAQPVVAAKEGTGWLVAYASQTGHAERLAWRSAEALTRAGHAGRVESVASLDPAALPAHGRVLLVASSFGDGGPPDSAQRFVRRLEALDPAAHPLRGLRFGLLALGDSHYDTFCGFGHRLDAALRDRGGHALFPLIEVDDGEADGAADGAALARWSAALGELGGARLAAEPPRPSADGPGWTLSRRQLLNPGSQGGPLFELTLTPDAAADWQPGALVDIVPRQPAAAVQAWLLAHRLSGEVMVRHGGDPLPLAWLLARCELPSTVHGDDDPQVLADTLKPLIARSYSVASIARDGAIDLLVRQERHAGGLGLASGWLTEHAGLGTAIDLRLVPNPSFAPLPGHHPAIYIGNGSGLAGLRSHLRERIAQGRRANWLLFGERESAHDRPCGDEIAHADAQGFLERVDLVFSRDPPGRVYVQDRLREAASDVRDWVDRGACLFVCGSLHGMSAGVDAALRDILGEDGLDDLIAAGRYRRDVY